MNQLEDPRPPPMTIAQEKAERLRNVALIAVSVAVLVWLAWAALA